MMTPKLSFCLYERYVMETDGLAETELCACLSSALDGGKNHLHGQPFLLLGNGFSVWNRSLGGSRSQSGHGRGKNLPLPGLEKLSSSR
jgi:hypothetical protein